MNGKKIDKGIAIKSMLSDLKKGIDRTSILGKFGKKWEIPKSTYYRWFEVADSEYQKFILKAKPIIEAKEIEALGEIAKAAILSKLERQILLSEFARGERLPWKEAVSKQGIEKLEAYDPLKYIAELNKMDGAYIEEEKSEDKITEITIRRVGDGA